MIYKILILYISIEKYLGLMTKFWNMRLFYTNFGLLMKKVLRTREFFNFTFSHKFKFVYKIPCSILMGIFVSMIHSFFTFCSIDWNVLKIGINHSSYLHVCFIHIFFILFTILQTHKIEFHVNHSTSICQTKILLKWRLKN